MRRLRINIKISIVCNTSFIEAQAIECAAKIYFPRMVTLVQEAHKQDGFVDLYAITVEGKENFFNSDKNILVHNFAFSIPLITWTIGEGIAILEGLTLAAAATVAVVAAVSVAMGEEINLGDFVIKLSNNQGSKASKGKYKGWKIEKDNAGHGRKWKL